MANDSGFEQNQLKQVIDTKDGTNDLPHEYTAQVQIPDMNCDTCTIQMIQSMEENPAAPNYYYSCADIKIVASSAGGGTGGSGGTNTAQGVGNGLGNSKAEFGTSCGLIQSSQSRRGSPPSGGSGLGAFSLLVPFALTLYLRRREVIRVQPK